MKVPIKNRTGANELAPLFVMFGVIILVVVGFIFGNQLFIKDDFQDDNGKYLDADDVSTGKPFAYFEINKLGTIKIELDQNKAPITVKNFIDLTEPPTPFYSGLTFHRVIPGFMIQGGDPSGDGSGGPGYTIESEADNGLTHNRGVIAMAKRGGDVRMSGSQFFIVHGQDGAHHLDGEHTVFGKVVEGMEVIDAIANVQTDANDTPLNPVIIESAYIVYE